MPARKWTDEQRATCRAVYEARGTSAAAHECEIPIGTVRGWVTRYGWRVSTGRRADLSTAVAQGALSWEARRIDLANRMGQLAADLLDTIARALEGGRISPETAVRGLAILVDKAQLLSGGATSRPDLDSAKLRDETDELLRRLAEQEGAR